MIAAAALSALAALVLGKPFLLPESSAYMDLSRKELNERIRQAMRDLENA